MGTINCGGNGVSSATFSAGAAGAHTVTVATPASSAQYAHVLGVGHYVAAARNKLEVITGGGTSGARSDIPISSMDPWYASQFYDYLNPDITLYMYGRNDAQPGGFPGPQFKKNVVTMVKLARETNSAEIVLIAPPPCNLANYPYDAAIRDALREVSDEHDVAMLDLRRRFGDRWALAPYPLSADTLHPNDAGMQAIAVAAAEILLS